MMKQQMFWSFEFKAGSCDMVQGEAEGCLFETLANQPFRETKEKVEKHKLGVKMNKHQFQVGISKPIHFFK